MWERVHLGPLIVKAAAQKQPETDKIHECERAKAILQVVGCLVDLEWVGGGEGVWVMRSHVLAPPRPGLTTTSGTRTW